MAAKSKLVEAAAAVQDTLRNPPPRPGLTLDSSGDSGQVITSVDYEIKTVDDALDRADVDRAIWEVERFTVNSWQVAMRMGSGDSEGVHKSTLWQVKVWLRRKVKRNISDAADGLIERMRKHSPAYRAVKYKATRDRHLLEVDLFDSHFGKLAWAPETGDTYDLGIAERVYQTAVADILSRVQHCPIERILYPIGQDFFHVNSPSNVTANGTPQDTDGRLAKIFESGCAAVINAIDHCLAIAPVEVLFVPGNHDRDISWHLCKFLEAWYRRTKNVTIDTRPISRKFYRYGVNLIGFTHGDEERHDALPAIMATSVPDLWAATKFREWHTGHFHKRKEVRYVAADSHGETVVRTLRSLSGTDSWHYRKGYIGLRAAEAFLYSRELGPRAHFDSFAPIGKEQN